ncbi:1-(5-phosphoribosyl)-5-[(5-phosphoribosylamino)methylideneamino]imidazole-4-carboxamide isomerase [Alicyclobacillus tolerans]|uniref:1-(5-phosphoribosyl)-5-[(5- phosphoribosylamino)methylideneamino]imidazole-4- carboxamide isomerase n=1 Tax=Alicyclobacillus tolerans TaxID=90970 RepID=UPI001F02F159|nr:1-(5-phosphoribosyl)-5-[(5-phosphoribosylamino)methylideneamino]imidazole-4-carboxamide isomerase [Alicyclobacillus tolerans]MCF8564036.1 1-(5-phosphoribosyl)-5-[(5-phosphoribosylamino)methylideneamino]imidazole-4-carboxamide isomerase [Alicyclobacillus tolerans]
MTELNPAFDVYPAIDILGGECVRLLRGDYNAKTQYSKDPVEMAKKWLDAGAKWLHVVDLDGAKSGTGENVNIIADIARQAEVYGARLEVGGGIRTHDSISRWMEAGVTRCVIGTAAMDEAFMEQAVSRFGSEALIVGLDGRGGKMAVHGWTEQTDVTLVSVAAKLHQVGVRYALVTDVDRDGTLTGANVSLARQIQDEAGLLAIASGGVKNLDDVSAARNAGLYGVILGRALYDGTLDIKEAIAAARTVESC